MMDRLLDAGAQVLFGIKISRVKGGGFDSGAAADDLPLSLSLGDAHVVFCRRALFLISIREDEPFTRTRCEYATRASA